MTTHNFTPPRPSRPLTSIPKLKVLLVEDQLVAQTTGAAIIKQFNCEVDFASTSKETIAQVIDKQYDLILMDIGMIGEDDGIKLAEKIRRVRGGINQSTPIVALTAHADAETFNNARAAGMNSYLIKPLTAEAFKEVLSDYCGVKFAPTNDIRPRI